MADEELAPIECVEEDEEEYGNNDENDNEDDDDEQDEQDDEESEERDGGGKNDEDSTGTDRGDADGEADTKEDRHKEHEEQCEHAVESFQNNRTLSLSDEFRAQYDLHSRAMRLTLLEEQKLLAKVRFVVCAALLLPYRVWYSFLRIVPRSKV